MVDDFLVDECGALNLGRGQSPAQQQAQDVLELLKSGTALEVTENMLAASYPQYLAANYDLPMDETSRMVPAKAMEFDIERTLYQGTSLDFPCFGSKYGGSSTGAFRAEVAISLPRTPCQSVIGRRCMPKGKEIGLMGDGETQPDMDRLNNRPRKCLGFKTPNQVFNEGMEAVARQVESTFLKIFVWAE